MNKYTFFYFLIFTFNYIRERKNKMKYYIIILILLFTIIPVTYATVGGNQEIIKHFNNCETIYINVTGSLDIDDYEYNILNCSEINKNEWVCNCTNNYDLILNTSLSTLNNYTFNITYNYSYEMDVHHHKKRKIIELNITESNETQIENNTMESNQTILMNETIDLNITIELNETIIQNKTKQENQTKELNETKEIIIHIKEEIKKPNFIVRVYNWFINLFNWF